MKQKSPIAALFARSPFKPMQQHMEVVDDCVVAGAGPVRCADRRRQAGPRRRQEAIFAKEGEADQIKNEVRLHLPKSLFLPVDRRDLLEVLEVQDAIADTAQDIAGLLLQREMTVPEDMQEDLKTLVERCVDACHQSNGIIGELDELVETGFRGPRRAGRGDGQATEPIESETDDLAIALSPSCSSTRTA
jgi:predicted phosphate transport protein (TIGR00153 family)